MAQEAPSGQNAMMIMLVGRDAVGCGVGDRVHMKAVSVK
jgi:hypothetical protein